MVLLKRALFVGSGILWASCSAGVSADIEEVERLEEALSCNPWCEFDLPVPRAHTPAEFAMSASYRLAVNDRCTVKEGVSPQAPAPIANVGTNFTGIGASSVVGSVYSQPFVQLRSNARITGTLTTPLMPEVQAGATYTRLVQQPVPTSKLWRLRVNWPTTPAPSPTYVSPGTLHPVALQPGVNNGSFTINANAIVRLAAVGDYYFTNLYLKPDAAIDIPTGGGRVRIFVSGTLSMKGVVRACASCTAPTSPFTMFSSPAATPRAENTLVMATGTSDVQVQRRTDFVLVAPEGSVNLDVFNNTTHTGAVFAKSIEMHQAHNFYHYAPLASLFEGLSAESPNRIKVTPTPATGVVDGMEAETAIAVARKANGSANIIIAYNNHADTSITHGANASTRSIAAGGTTLGYSVSEDGGDTFTTRGRVVPESGFSLIYSDPAAAADGTSGEVYLGMMAESTARWTAQTGSATASLDNNSPNVDGFCVGKSADFGLTFPTVDCFVGDADVAAALDLEQAPVDGTALALTSSYVYFAGRVLNRDTSADLLQNGASVFRSARGTSPLTFERLPEPPPELRAIDLHPRLRSGSGRLYLLGATSDPNGTVPGTLHIAAWNEATTAWEPALRASTVNDVPTGIEDSPIDQADQFGFDVKIDSSTTPTQDVVRVVYADTSGTLRFVECRPPNGCQALNWSVSASGVLQMSPVIAYGGGRWMVRWQEAGSFGVSVKAAELFGTGSSTDAAVRIYSVAAAQNPCTTAAKYWGDYDDIAWVGGAPNQTATLGWQRFFTTFTRNGPSCVANGEWAVPMDVYGATLL
jgi:hypothetical protein